MYSTLLEALICLQCFDNTGVLITVNFYMFLSVINIHIIATAIYRTRHIIQAGLSTNELQSKGGKCQSRAAR